MANNLLTNYQRSKEDNNSDDLFYASPRYVHHLDQPFRTRLTNLYRQKIHTDSIVLDLMSSWVSHLPLDTKYNKVIGHGLNLEELQSNKRFDSYWVQNLNISQILPLDDNSIDVCLMCAAWQYLQYPEAVALEIKRILKPNGQIIVSFSNRAFWTKSPKIWVQSSDSDRIEYINNILSSQGFSQLSYISEPTYKSFPLSLIESNGDPFYSVLARA